MQDKDIKDEVLEEDINKEEVKEEAHEHGGSPVGEKR